MLAEEFRGFVLGLVMGKLLRPPMAVEVWWLTQQRKWVCKTELCGDHKRKSLIWTFYFDGREREIHS